MGKINTLILFILSSSAVFGQVFTTPGGAIGSNGTVDQVKVNGATLLVNPTGRTLLVERENEDSWLTFHDPGDSWYSMGIDRSNNSSFTLNYGGILGANNHFTMSNTGNIGIGTTSPQSKLDVRGGAVQVVNYADGAYSFIGRNADPGNDSYFYHLVSPNFHILGSNKNGSGIQRKLGFALGGGDTENDIKMVIDAQGRIGMGTTSPGLKLHLFTSNSLDGLGVHHSNGAWVNFYSPSMTGGAFNGITQPGDGGLIFGNDSGLNSVSNGFVIAPHRNTVSGLRINNNGDVGIGTSSPDAKLTVKGTIHSNEVKIDLSVPGPDYVFSNNYSLPTLNEIKAYIDQNKHLPEVPSAKEMETNGVNVGEMNMILLKKVEELTLYAIEQNKQIGQLKQKLLNQDTPEKNMDKMMLMITELREQNEQLAKEVRIIRGEGKKNITNRKRK